MCHVPQTVAPKFKNNKYRLLALTLGRQLAEV